MERLREVHQVEDILLETRTTEADGRAQEFGANTGIVPDSVRDFIDVGTCRLTDRGECVYRGYTLSEHGVRREFRQLGGPKTNGQDALTPETPCQSMGINEKLNPSTAANVKSLHALHKWRTTKRYLRTQFKRRHVSVGRRKEDGDQQALC